MTNHSQLLHISIRSWDIHIKSYHYIKNQTFFARNATLSLSLGQWCNTSLQTSWTVSCEHRKWCKDRIFRGNDEMIRPSVCLHVCLSVCSSVCLSVCLSSRLPVCLSVCLCVSVFLSVCLPVCLSVCPSACVCVFLSACLSVFLSACVCVFLSACVCLCVSFCLPVCLCLSSLLQPSRLSTCMWHLCIQRRIFPNLLFFPPERNTGRNQMVAPFRVRISWKFSSISTQSWSEQATPDVL